MAIIYGGLVFAGDPPPVLYPRRFVGDVFLVEGWQARSRHSVEVMLVARDARKGIMRSFRRDVGEERRLIRADAGVDELQSLRFEHVGGIVASLSSEVLTDAVVVDVVIEVIYRMKKSKPFIPVNRARGKSRVGEACAVLVEVLAEKPSVVASCVKLGSDVLIFIAETVVAFPATVGAIDVEPDTGVMSVLTAHDGGPCGATQRGGDECVLEAHALVLPRSGILYQSGVGLWHVRGIEVVVAHVVGEYEDYVGISGIKRRLRMAGRHAQANEH